MHSKFWRKAKPYCAVLPPCFMVIFLVGISVGESLKSAFGWDGSGGLVHGTDRYFRQVLSDTAFQKSLVFTLKTSLISSLTAVSAGVALAFFYHRRKTGDPDPVYYLPLIVPHTVVALMVFQIFSQTGFLARLFYFFGWIQDYDQFWILVYDRHGIGMILSYLWKEIPFVFVTMYGVLQRLNPHYEWQARVLGASSFRAFRKAVFPMILPHILYCFILLFLFSFGAYELPRLLGPTAPRALAVQAYIEYTNPVPENRPIAMVYNTLIMSVGFVFAFFFFKWFNRSNTHKEGSYE